MIIESMENQFCCECSKLPRLLRKQITILKVCIIYSQLRNELSLTILNNLSVPTICVQRSLVIFRQSATPSNIRSDSHHSSHITITITITIINNRICSHNSQQFVFVTCVYEYFNLYSYRNTAFFCQSDRTFSSIIFLNVYKQVVSLAVQFPIALSSQIND